nr:retrovirus-related Pol polyprotein from transposon TNT 1-94 [Tanacetum cinerariifolium]
MKEKGDACIFVGYSTQSRSYRVFNKRTRVIVETIHVNFDELPQMASDHVSSDPIPECQRTALEHDSLSPGYSTQSRAYRVFNKRTRVIAETIHVNFDKLPQMASDHVSSDPDHECQRMALKHDSLSPSTQCQENVTQADKTVTTSNELDLLFSPMFDELLNESSKVVLKSSAVTTADAPNQHQ